MPGHAQGAHSRRTHSARVQRPDAGVKTRDPAGGCRPASRAIDDVSPFGDQDDRRIAHRTACCSSASTTQSIMGLVSVEMPMSWVPMGSEVLRVFRSVVKDGFIRTWRLIHSHSRMASD